MTIGSAHNVVPRFEKSEMFPLWFSGLEGGLLLTEKELKKLSRYQLLEMLIMQTERADALQQQLDALQTLANAKDIQMSNLGSIADASIQVSGVFEAAQAAADLYLDAARKQAAEIVQEARRQSDEIIARAEAKAKIFASIHKANFGPHSEWVVS